MPLWHRTAADPRQPVCPLARAGANRLPWLPDLPTAAEAIFPGFDANTWLVLAVPRGTPSAVIATISELALPTIRSPRVRELLDRHGIVAEAAGADVLGTMWQRENGEWSAVIRDARISGE